MDRKLHVPYSELKKLYAEKNLSTYKIAKIFNCNPSLIQRRLKEYNISIRYPKKKIDLSKNLLRNLYWNKCLSTYKIAKKLRIGRTTIYSKLIEYGIETRPKKIVFISKKELEKLYHEKKMPLSKIAKKYNCSHSIILDKMKKHGIARRNFSEANMIYPKKEFNGNRTKKAYMIGFRLGDLTAERKCNQTFIQMNTTKKEQVELFKKVYGKYGHFHSKKYGNVFRNNCFLHNSFSFLIPKNDKIEEWILKNKKTFFAFLAGYTDAEGIGVYDGRARFRLGSYDKNLLKQTYNKLNSLGICARYVLETKAGTRDCNQDFWRVSVNEKQSLIKLFSLLKSQLKHEKRINDLKKAEKNILERNSKYDIRSVR